MLANPRSTPVASGSTVLPAAASIGVRHLLAGPRQYGLVLGASSNAAWLAAGGHVVALTKPGDFRLPNGVTVAEHAKTRCLQSGDRGVIGDGRLEIGSVNACVVRWWDPRPRLDRESLPALTTRCLLARRRVAQPTDEGLGRSLRRNDTDAVHRSVRALLGRGAGLTPEGDDILVGLLAGLRLLGAAVEHPGAGEMLAMIARVAITEAPIRTTALSLALLRHAAAGEVADPVATFLKALTGRGDVGVATSSLQTMGQTSGVATARGVLLAADYLAARGSP